MLSGLEDARFDAHDTTADHTERARGSQGEVEDASAHVRAAIVDDDFHAAAGTRICNPQAGAERQCTVRASQAGRVE